MYNAITTQICLKSNYNLMMLINNSILASEFPLLNLNCKQVLLVLVLPTVSTVTYKSHNSRGDEEAGHPQSHFAEGLARFQRGKSEN